jgi:hypothetical protein
MSNANRATLDLWRIIQGNCPSKYGAIKDAYQTPMSVGSDCAALPLRYSLDRTSAGEEKPFLHVKVAQRFGWGTPPSFRESSLEGFILHFQCNLRERFEADGFLSRN